MERRRLKARVNCTRRETDFTSMHGSCPVTKGEKYSATKWVGRSIESQVAHRDHLHSMVRLRPERIAI